MLYSRRDLGKIALAALPAAAFLEEGTLSAAPLFQAKPNSMFGGVQIGTITYSYRSMPDQSAEATLKYIVDSGISAVELMGGPVNDWLLKKGNPPASMLAGRAGGRGGGGGGARAAGPGGPGAPGGRGAAGAAAADAPVPVGPMGKWGDVTCDLGRGRGAGGGGGRAAAPGIPAAAVGGAAAAPPAGGGGGRGAAQTPEQIAAAEEQRKWKLGLPMSIFTDLRKMYNDAGVSIYAVKDINGNGTDEELDYYFQSAKALGASHVTLELPAGPDAAKTLKRLGDFALKNKMYAAYHTHQQGSMTCFDEAFAISKGNMANVDLGHFVAATNPGGTPMDFLNKFHDRVSSFHIKDRTSVEHCALNLAWGSGETPLKDILKLVQKNKWKIPASIELEYSIPADSDAVKETKKCVQFCKDILLS